MVVQLLAGVVAVEILAVPLDLVRRVLDAPDAAVPGILRHADRVAEAPAEHDAVGGVVQRSAGDRRHIEALDHGPAARDRRGFHVEVAAGAAGDEQQLRVLRGDEQRARRMTS